MTTLTKRMAEELTNYYAELGVSVRYLHSEVQTLERMDIIRELREGKFDVLVGINLLREGLDIPEVALVAMLDADKEGFLRSTRSLIQTIGRAARNVNGRVILYADQETESIRETVSETNRRREIQQAFNAGERDHAAHDHEADHEHPRVDLGAGLRDGADRRGDGRPGPAAASSRGTIERLRREMRDAAKQLEFERAADLRDRIRVLESQRLTARLVSRVHDRWLSADRRSPSGPTDCRRRRACICSRARAAACSTWARRRTCAAA